jgi:hypothetical protein
MRFRAVRVGDDRAVRCVWHRVGSGGPALSHAARTALCFDALLCLHLAREPVGSEAESEQREDVARGMRSWSRRCCRAARARARGSACSSHCWSCWCAWMLMVLCISWSSCDWTVPVVRVGLPGRSVLPPASSCEEVCRRRRQRRAQRAAHAAWSWRRRLRLEAGASFRVAFFGVCAVDSPGAAPGWRFVTRTQLSSADSPPRSKGRRAPSVQALHTQTASRLAWRMADESGSGIDGICIE